MWDYGLVLGDPDAITCSEEGAQHNAVPFLVITHFPAPKCHNVLCHNNQPGQKEKGGQTGELFCLFYLPAPRTNTSSVYFISPKMGGVQRGRGVVSIEQCAAIMRPAAAGGVLCLLLAG